MSYLSPAKKTLLILFILAAALELLLRGPVRFLQASDVNDFISPYVQSKALLEGLDPYSPEVLVQLWPNRGEFKEIISKDLAEHQLIARRGFPTAYPLTCLLLLTPLAAMPWKAAYLVWLALTLCLVACLLWSLMALCDFDKNDWRAYVFLAVALALAPLHTALAKGSIVIPAVALCGIALLEANRSRHDFLAGILFGIAVGLKPQIGLPFVAYYFFRQRWKPVLAACGIVAVTATAAMMRLAMSGAPWLQNYQNDNRVLFLTGALSDFTERNPMRFGLINLQVLFYAIGHRVRTANSFALLASAFLFALWILLLLRTKPIDAMLPISAIAVISLFPVYHRMYDAFLLIFPLAWSLKTSSSGKNKLAFGTFLLILPFLVPGGSLLEHLQFRGRIPGAVKQSWFWNDVMLPHQIWILLFLSLLLLAQMFLLPRHTAGRRPDGETPNTRISVRTEMQAHAT